MMLHPSAAGMAPLPMSTHVDTSYAEPHHTQAPPYSDGPTDADEFFVSLDEEEAHEDTGTSLQAQSLKRAYSPSSGVYRVHWLVDARKLRGNDKQAVSPPFELFSAHRQHGATFKMMIYPCSSG